VWSVCGVVLWSVSVWLECVWCGVCVVCVEWNVEWCCVSAVWSWSGGECSVKCGEWIVEWNVV
jgi:hypothetical protein